MFFVILKSVGALSRLLTHELLLKELYSWVYFAGLKVLNNLSKSTKDLGNDNKQLKSGLKLIYFMFFTISLPTKLKKNSDITLQTM
jgi:hypothetical protein